MNESLDLLERVAPTPSGIAEAEGPCERGGDADLDEERLPADPVGEAHAQEHERKVRGELNTLFRQLKLDAQAIYGLSCGAPGARTPEQFAALLEKAGDELGNGRFLVRKLGAERYLDVETVAVLITLRQNLIAEVDHAGAAEIMMIDAAVVGYFNMMRAQGWIGNLSLVVERELFGQAPLNEIHGSTVGAALEEKLRRLAEVILPLQERSTRMMLRSLEALRSGARRPTRKRSSSARSKAAFPVT
jgi:hypothetical protein